MTPMHDTDRTTQVLAVTAGLTVAGGFVGGLCAAIAVATIAAIEGGQSGLVSRSFVTLLGVSAGFGAAVGMIGAPLLGWGLLRRVPLGRAVAFTAVGTVIGAVDGELIRPLNPYARDIPAVLIGALVGFVLAGIVVRLRTVPTATIAGEPYADR